MTTSSFMPWKKTDLAWLSLAIGVHGALLLLPLRPLQSPAELRSSAPRPALAVELMPYTRSNVTHITQEIPLPLASEQSTASTPRARGKLSAATATKLPVPADAGLPNDTAKQEITRFSAAQLVDLVSRMSFTELPSPAPRQLGSGEHSKQASAWRTGAQAGALTAERNTFEGMMAPGKTEVIDRWLAADGSQNLVITTPGGETLCGRGEAWDPMHPLVEHLIMFRSCLGGGKRTFTLAAREYAY